MDRADSHRDETSDAEAMHDRDRDGDATSDSSMAHPSSGDADSAEAAANADGASAASAEDQTPAFPELDPRGVLAGRDPAAPAGHDAPATPRAAAPTDTVADAGGDDDAEDDRAQAAALAAMLGGAADVVGADTKTPGSFLGAENMPDADDDDASAGASTESFTGFASIPADDTDLAEATSDGASPPPPPPPPPAAAVPAGVGAGTGSGESAVVGAATVGASNPGAPAPGPEVVMPAGKRGGGGLIGLLTLLTLLIGGAFVLWQSPQEATATASRGWYDDVDEATLASEAEGRPLLVLFTADWCPPCQHMKKNVFPDADVKALIEQGFVPVKVDLTDRGGENTFVAQRYGVNSIPQIHIYHPSGYQIARSYSVQSPSQFEAFLLDSLRQMR